MTKRRPSRSRSRPPAARESRRPKATPEPPASNELFLSQLVPAPKERIAITELAQRLGLSRKAVTGHIERGAVPSSCVSRGPQGWVITDAKGAEDAILRQRELVPLDDPDDLAIQNINWEDQATWPRSTKGLQIVREYWAAHAAKRKADIASRDLVRTEDVNRELFTASRLIRDQLVTWPDRAANDLAAELGVADATCVRSSMQKTVDRMLGDLATELERALVAAGADDKAGGEQLEDEAEADGGAGVPD